MDFLHFSHCVFCGSFTLVSVAWISNKWLMRKAVCSPETPVGGSKVVCRQFGQHRVCPSRSLTTKGSRHFLQNVWKHGSSFGLVYISRQTEHSSWAVIFFSASSATFGDSAITNLLYVQYVSFKCTHHCNESTSGVDASVLCTVYYYTHIHELSKIPWPDFIICHVHCIQSSGLAHAQWLYSISIIWALVYRWLSPSMR